MVKFAQKNIMVDHVKPLIKFNKYPNYIIFLIKCLIQSIINVRAIAVEYPFLKPNWWQ